MTCNHPSVVTDPETGKDFCETCGLQLVDKPVSVGGRLIPPEEYLRRVQGVIRLIDDEILQREQRKHELLLTAARVRDVRCQWPNCQAPPLLRSKWCPEHKRQHSRELARERQRRHRSVRCVVTHT